MSYAALGFLSFTSGGYNYPDIKSGGQLISWWGEDWDDDEVYVFRFRVSGLPAKIENASQVYPLLRAYVDSIPVGLRNQDVRGIALKPSGGFYLAEIIITDAGGYHTGKMHADDHLARMRAALENAGSSLSLDQPAFAYINNDLKAKVNFWFSQPALWSFKSYDAAGKGSMAQGFTRSYMDQQGVWLNSSAVSPQYMLRPPPPVVIEPPTPKPAPPKPGPDKTGKTPASTPAMTESMAGGTDPTTLVVLGVAVAAAIFWTQKRKRRGE